MFALVYSHIGLSYIGYLLLLPFELGRDSAFFPLNEAHLVLQPALMAQLLVYLLIRCPRMHAGIVAVCALIPVAADLVSGMAMQLDAAFWPIDALLGEFHGDPMTPAIIVAVELLAAVWLGLAVARPPRGYTGAAEN